MHVMPWGQKKPSQQGWQAEVRAGISRESVKFTGRAGPALQAHPGSQPETHAEELQFVLGFKKEEEDFELAMKFVK